MGKFLTTSVAAAAFALSSAMGTCAFAQDKKATMKVIAENAKVKAYEVTFAPGAGNASVPASSVRVVRAIKGGTLERTYADGKKEKVVYKTGEVRINEASPAFTTKNIGKGEIKLYVVQVK